MEALRQSLHTRIDCFLNGMFEGEDFADDVQLKIEACVFQDSQVVDSPDQIVYKKVVINCGNIKQWRAMPTISRPAAMPNRPSSPSMHSREPDAAVDPISVQDSSTYTDLAKGMEGVRDKDECHVVSRKRVVLAHKSTGGLRPGSNIPTNTPPRTPSPPTVRQLETDERPFTKRRKLDKAGPAKLEPSTIDKLVEGMWRLIHRPGSLALGRELQDVFDTVQQRITSGETRSSSHSSFDAVSRRCQSITAGSRTNRALEVIVQAHWFDCYECRISALREARSDLKTGEVRKMVLAEACEAFHWSEKELRNRMAIWKGYREIKNAAGWSALVFAGPGIYRFCKYRLGFDQEALMKLQQLRTRLEVAADTLQPQWRQLLSLVGAATQLHWRGHPHDWVVSKRKDPVPLTFTYRQWDPEFNFIHLIESVLDTTKWGTDDPRRSSNGPDYTCDQCSRPQSLSAELNECDCFADFFGPIMPGPPAVQVFRTENGRNNGLIACCAFERGSTVGEFVGLITKGLSNVDVMQSQVTTISGDQKEAYQIWQGRQGNYTRFINHSCQPNCQFQTFTWLGIQRILVVSKGVPAGKEITVDYLGRYWRHLDKLCLCGETKCRYSNIDRING